MSETREENLHGVFMIEEESAQPDENSAKKTKEDNAWNQRVTEVPRTEYNEELILEMARRMDEQFDKPTT